MEVIDKRRLDENGDSKPAAEPAPRYDSFKPTLKGCTPHPDLVLVRVLNLPEEGLIATPDAFAEPSLYGEIQNGGGTIVRFLKDVGTTVDFSDGLPGARYRLIHRDDVVCSWSDAPHARM